jgi:hypothetical protein
MKCICGTIVPFEEKRCPNCGRENSDSIIEEITKKYGITEDALLSLGNITFLDSINDNCIIYDNGMIDAFNKPEELIEALSECGTHLMSEMHEDIIAIIYKGTVAKFTMVNKVEFFKPETRGIEIKAEDVLFDDQLNGTNYLLTLRDALRTVMKFASGEKMAEWLLKNGDENVSMIFINREYYDHWIHPVLKLNDIEIEIHSGVPF